MQPELLKYFLDIESVIKEIEVVKARAQNHLLVFQADIILQRAIERDLEIIGEAVKKIIELRPDIRITSARKMIGLRNIISHAYDSVEAELTWSIIKKDIPILSGEIERLRQA
ncbi:MAG: DUF86 domain-containing protein [Bacteroidota bacterium]|nr:DUF86 domain-containing protein [Bacteroidota bacterium]